MACILRFQQWQEILEAFLTCNSLIIVYANNGGLETLVVTGVGGGMQIHICGAAEPRTISFLGGGTPGPLPLQIINSSHQGKIPGVGQG